MPNTEQTNFAFSTAELRKEAEKRSFMKKFPSYDNSYAEALVKEYNNVEAPAPFVKCKDAIYSIIADERNKALHSPSFDSTDHYLSAIKGPIVTIAEELGDGSIHYQNITNVIIQTTLSLLIDTVWAEHTVSAVKEAKQRAEQLFTLYPITDSTKESISRTIVELGKIENEYVEDIKRAKKEKEKASRLSERMRRFADNHSSMPSGGKRYTSPGWALLILIILGLAFVISIFETILSVFKFKRGNDV